MESLVPAAAYPSLLATPSPGICVKTKTDGGDKFFINLCKLNEIPSPPPITEQELEDMIEKEVNQEKRLVNMKEVKLEKRL